jgi:LAS superfamily LD-carboxypeptidase LdcB
VSSVRSTRTILVAVAAGVVAVLMLRVADESTLLAVAPRPSPLAPREELESYPAFGYRQGIQQTIEVVTVGASPVELTTAHAFLAMRDAAALADISLTIESGFRTHAEQQVLYSAWRRGRGNRAAKPGESNHQSGRALDISVKDPETYAWLSANAGQFGFKRTVAGEPWHWEYVNTPRARSQSIAKISKAKKSASKKSSGRAARSRSRSVVR